MVHRSTRRARAEIYEQSHLDCWLVVGDPWHKIIRSEKLPAGTDLMRRFLAELLRYHDSGWKLNEFSSHTAHFFASKKDDKHYVQIVVSDPAVPKPEHRGYRWM
jgi:hypothetical protein